MELQVPRVGIGMQAKVREDLRLFRLAGDGNGVRERGVTSELTVTEENYFYEITV